VYELDEQLQPVKKFYLGDQEAAMRKAAAVANQAQTR
jgi:2,3-bisphosphoglycerate-dependent phosphoglycerate mutase